MLPKRHLSELEQKLGLETGFQRGASGSTEMTTKNRGDQLESKP